MSNAAIEWARKNSRTYSTFGSSITVDQVALSRIIERLAELEAAIKECEQRLCAAIVEQQDYTGLWSETNDIFLQLQSVLVGSSPALGTEGDK